MAPDSLRWETLDSTVAYSCPGFDVVTEDVRLPDGTETEFDYLTESPSVCILPFLPDGDVVCIQEWRQAVSRVSTGLPVGGVEPTDADLEAAARRELAEETGHEAETLDALTTVEMANGIADTVLHYFVARGCRPTAAQALDHNESIDVTSMAYEDLLAAVRDGDVRDGRAVLALSYYELLDDS